MPTRGLQGTKALQAKSPSPPHPMQQPPKPGRGFSSFPFGSATQANSHRPLQHLQLGVREAGGNGPEDLIGVGKGCGCWWRHGGSSCGCDGWVKLQGHGMSSVLVGTGKEMGPGWVAAGAATAARAFWTRLSIPCWHFQPSRGSRVLAGW